MNLLCVLLNAMAAAINVSFYVAWHGPVNLGAAIVSGFVALYFVVREAA